VKQADPEERSERNEETYPAGNGYNEQTSRKSTIVPCLVFANETEARRVNPVEKENRRGRERRDPAGNEGNE
jgi:hypothetical protein